MLGFAALTVAATAAPQGTEKLMLSLEQSLEIALSQSPTIKIADQQIEIKR